MIPKEFRGRAARLVDVDLPRVGHMLGVGEDEIHAVLDVEARGSGFDSRGRPTMLFEPHLFWRELGGSVAKRTRAAALGLAYEKWGTKPYPADSYPRLVQAMAIDETAAIRSASWGLGQLLGSNHRAAGYATPQLMVAAFCDSEAAQLEGMAMFIKAGGLDKHLRAHAWAAFARLYNGPGYAKNKYDTRLAAAYAKWSRINDTPWSPTDAAVETVTNDPITPHVVAPPVEAPIIAGGGSSGGAGASGAWDSPAPPISAPVEPVPAPSAPSLAKPASQAPSPAASVSREAQELGFVGRFLAALAKRLAAL